MTIDDKEKILQKVEKLLTENLRYMEATVSYKEADGSAYSVRFLIFDEADKPIPYEAENE